MTAEQQGSDAETCVCPREWVVAGGGCMCSPPTAEHSSEEGGEGLSEAEDTCPRCGRHRPNGCLCHIPVHLDVLAQLAATREADQQVRLDRAIDWDSPTWGQLSHNVHVAAWAPDGRHDDVTEEE